MGSRKAFRKTAIARIESGAPLRGDAFWLQSDNGVQKSTGLVGINLEWVDKKLGTLGASWLKILSVDATEFLGSLAHRDHMGVFNIRAKGNLGIEQLFLASGYVQERFNVTARNRANARVCRSRIYIFFIAIIAITQLLLQPFQRNIRSLVL